MDNKYDPASLMKGLADSLKKLRAVDQQNLKKDDVSARVAWNNFQIAGRIIEEYTKLETKNQNDDETFKRHSSEFSEIKNSLLHYIPESIKKETLNLDELMKKCLGIDKPSLPQPIIDELKKLRKEQSLELCVLRIEKNDACNIYVKQNPTEALKCYDRTDIDKYPIRCIIEFKRDIVKGKEEFTPIIVNPDKLRNKLEEEHLKKEILENKVTAITPKETTEKKSTAPELKPQEGPYLEILAKMTSPYGSIWKESGDFKPKEYKTAAEFLEDTQKHIKPGRKYYTRKEDGSYEEIPAITIQSYLKREAEKESQKPKDQSKP